MDHMDQVTIYSADELRGLIIDGYGEDDAPQIQAMINRWLARGDGAAVYTNEDLGHRDVQGYITLVGRAKDLIITGGLNVYPKEVEACLDALDGVLESAVIGLPHPDFGEAVAAVVVRAPGCDEVTETALIDRLKEELAGFKVPKRVFFSASLPRNAMGKVQKNLLREQHYVTATAG